MGSPVVHVDALMLEVVQSVPDEPRRISKRSSQSGEIGYVPGTDEPRSGSKRSSMSGEFKRGSKTLANLPLYESPEERERRLKAEKRAKERQERHASAVAYVTKNKLDQTVQTKVNRVLNDRPKDPYSALVKHLSAFSKDRPRFAMMRARPDGLGNIRLTLDVRIRGAVIQSHVAQLHKVIATKLQGEGGEEAPTNQASFNACAKFQDSFGRVLTNIEVTDFRQQRMALRNGARALQEKYGEEVMPSQGIIDELSGLLLDAEGRLMNLPAHRSLKSWWLTQKLKVSPRMQISEDFRNWEHQWPEIVLPVFEGKIKHQICLGMTLWAATLPDLRVSGEFGTPEFLCVSEENPDQVAEGEKQVPDKDYCPPINAVSMLAKLGSALVAQATSGGTAMPGNDDFGAAAKNLQAAITAKLPHYAEAEQKLLKIKATAEGSLDEGTEFHLTEKEQHKCVYGVVIPDANAAWDAETRLYDFYGDPENALKADDLIDMYVQLFESNPFLTVLVRPFSTKDTNRFELLSKLRLRLPVDVVLIGDHGPLQPDRSGEVRVRKGGMAASASQGSLKGGMANSASQASLGKENSGYQGQLNDAPQAGAAGNQEQVGVGEDGLPTFRESQQSPQERADSRLSDGAGQDDDRTAWPDGTGFIRACGSAGLHPFGIAATYEQFTWAFSLKPGLYDLSLQEFPCVLPFVDVSLALPESKRLFLLPRLDVEALTAVLEPVSSRMRGIMEGMFRQGHAEQGEDMPDGLDLAEFTSGLQKLGYADVEEYAKPLYEFLDNSNNHSISEHEISVLESVDRPATLKDVDNLRIFLVANQGKLAGPNADEVQTESAIKLLWKRLDRNNSGTASFHEFKRVLKALKFPNMDKALQLFMCIDLKNNGLIDETEWSLLGVLSSNFKLERVEKIRQFIIKTFKTMTTAYKAIDKNKSGALSVDEWIGIFSEEYDYDDPDDVKACFEFLDKDCSNVISNKEFQFLGAFEREDFMREVRTFADYLIGKYENIDNAYDEFDAHSGKTKRNSTDGNPPGTGDSTKLTKLSLGSSGNINLGCIDPKEFIDGFKRSGFQGSYDPRLIFNFLDAARNGHVSRTEFKLLEKLDAVEEMNKSAEFMTSALASFKQWVAEKYPGDADKDSWGLVHHAITEAAREED